MLPKPFGGWPVRKPHHGTPVEVLTHCLGDVGDAVPHQLKTLQERAKRIVLLALDGFEVPWLHQLIGE